MNPLCDYVSQLQKIAFELPNKSYLMVENESIASYFPLGNETTEFCSWVLVGVGNCDFDADIIKHTIFEGNSECTHLTSENYIPTCQVVPQVQNVVKESCNVFIIYGVCFSRQMWVFLGPIPCKSVEFVSAECLRCTCFEDFEIMSLQGSVYHVFISIDDVLVECSFLVNVHWLLDSNEM